MKHLFLALIASSLLACHKKKNNESTPATPQLEMQVNPVFGSQNLYIDSNYTLSDGSRIQFKEIKFIFTQVKNGSNTLTDAAMFDYHYKGHAFFSAQGDASNFSSFTAFVGVDSATNHSNPAAFADDSPLNITNAGDMHWDWNVGYIFVKIEAKADTIPDGIDNFDHSIIWHSGTDLNLSTVSFPSVSWSDAGSNLMLAKLKLDMRSLIERPGNALNIKTEFMTHSGLADMPIAQKVMQNFCASISAE